MRYLIGTDIGTSGTKTVLFDIDGNIVKTAYAEYPMYQPQNGWAEQNPSDWKDAALSTIKEVANKDVVGISFSGQMHGLVMLDEKNEVIRPSIIWCDTRTTKQCREITEKIGGERLIEITANPALEGFTASKILWVRENEPENYEKCRHILLPKDYVRFCLTGEYATEVSDAGGMQLLDIKKRCWSDEVLEKLDIEKALLPKVYESPEVTGYITKEIAEITGLPEGIPVAGGAGDNAAAAVGVGVVKNGRAFTTIGTSGVVFAHTDAPLIDKLGRVHTFCCAVPGKWHSMGVMQAAGLSLKWFRDGFCESEISSAKAQGIDPYVLMDKESECSPIGSNKLLFMPYLMGERTPHLDADCRGGFVGISAIHKKGDFIRAIMEGVSFALCNCRDVLAEMGIDCSDMTVCGGGAYSPLWRQVLSDVYNTPIKSSSSKEGAALGAAILAGVGAGVYTSVEEACDRLITAKNVTVPQSGEEYSKYYNLYNTLYPSLKNFYKELSKI